MTAFLSALCMLPGFEKELRFLPILLRPGAVCIDVGASLGAYSIPMAVIVGASGAVVAFEPRGRAASRLRRLGKMLRLSALCVEEAALGCRVGRDRLLIPGRRRPVPGRSFLTGRAVCSGLDDELVPHATVDVAVTTLDMARRELGRRIDFVKCDVEGAESEVFAGAATVLTEDRPLVLCEIEGRHTRRYGRTVDETYEMFQRYGYGPVRLVVDACDPGDHDARNILLAPAERIPSLEARLGV